MDKKDPSQQEFQININLDTTPILYTDNIFMTVSDDGIVFDVGQKVGPSHQMRIVARIGMSKEHAKKFVKEMGKLLAMSEGHLQTAKKN